MKEHPILFSAPMVRAILAGKKTQTRRIVKSAHVDDAAVWHDNGDGTWGSGIASGAPGSFGHGEDVRCPYGVVGDRLWVRETWQAIHVDPDGDVDAAPEIPKDSRGGWWGLAHAATDEQATYHKDDRGFVWRPGIHMPRWASRLTLEIVAVKVQRLQDTTVSEARAEGIIERDRPDEFSRESVVAVDGRSYLNVGCAWAGLWDSINGKRAPWALNPWVWAITFRRVTP